MTKGTKTRANGGFTLVEVLVAIAILGVVATSMGGCLVVSQRVNARSQNVIEERAAVTNVVEKLMAEGIDITNSYTVGSSLSPTSPAEQKTEYTKTETIDGLDVNITAIILKEKIKVSVRVNQFVEFGDRLWKVWVTCGDVEVVTYIHGKSS